MAGLLGDLVNAARALSAHQAGVQVAGRNIANVATPGYARQRVILGERATVQTALGAEGSGVEALGIKQIRDFLLDRQVVSETSRTEYLQSMQTAYSRAEIALGEQIDRLADSASLGDVQAGTGIAGALSDFFSSFDHLATSPSDVAAKQVLFQKAQALVGKFNVTDQRLTNLQDDLTTQIDTDTTTVNSLLQQIGDLNKEIQGYELAAPASALELRDQRQMRLEELGKYLNFTSTTIPGSGGQIQISVKDTGGADVVLVDRAIVTGPLTFTGSGFTGGGAAAALSFSGGSLQGNLTARDGGIQQLRNDLKTTADQLATAVNAAYNPTSATGNFFNIPPSSGILELDSTLSVSTLKATDTANSGANELALAVADLGTKRFATGSGDLINGTIGDFYNKTVTGLGEDISSLDSQLTDQRIIQGMVTQQRDSVSGVSMDEEVADLMKFQRAFQASSRVIGVIDSMLESLINSVG